MRYLITGSGGFIGNAITNFLLDRGHHVTAIYRNNKPYIRNDKLVNVIKMDLENFDNFGESFDSVVYCAVEDPHPLPYTEEIRDRNKICISNVLKNSSSVKNFIYLSSMAVYGKIKESVVNEETIFQSPDIYGLLKYDGELLLEDWVRDTRGTGIALRLPGIVGHGSHGNFLSKVFNSIKNGEKVNISNPNGMFNNIVFVEDLAKFVLYLSNQSFPNMESYVIGSKSPITILETVERLYDLMQIQENISIVEASSIAFTIDYSKATSHGFKSRTVDGSLKSFVKDSLNE